MPFLPAAMCCRPGVGNRRGWQTGQKAISGPAIFQGKDDENMAEKAPELTEEEKKVMQILRTIGFGKVVITVKNGKPVYVETQKTIQLSEH